MNMLNILNQFTGADNSNAPSDQNSQGASTGLGNGIGSSLGKLASNIPGGLAGGAAAGGVMALLMSSKSARKIATKTAAYGGAAVLGGIAFSAFKNWKNNNANTLEDSSLHSVNQQQNSHHQNNGTNNSGNNDLSVDFQLTLIKAMIAAAKADGHIDAEEQQRIFNAVEQMNLDHQMKGLVFDLLRQPIFIEELAHGAVTIEQKTEVYLASCLAINSDHPSEKAHLDKLAQALQLPAGLPEEVRRQAQQALTHGAV